MTKKLSTMLFLIATTAAATPVEPSCTEKLNACDAALSACDQAIQSIIVTLKNDDDLVSQLKDKSVILQEQNEALNSWYHNPYVLVPLGIAAGALGAAYLYKGGR